MKMSNDTLKKMILLEAMLPTNKRFQKAPKVQGDPEKVAEHGETFVSKSGTYFIVASDSKKHMNATQSGQTSIVSRGSQQVSKPVKTYSVFFLDNTGNGKLINQPGTDLSRGEAVSLMKHHHDKKSANLTENNGDYDKNSFDHVNSGEPRPEELGETEERMLQFIGETDFSDLRPGTVLELVSGPMEDATFTFKVLKRQ